MFDEKFAKDAMDRANNHWKTPEGNPDVQHIMSRQPGPIEVKDRYKNKWEREYASYLDQLKHLKEILWWEYEFWGFRLADNTFIYPDFAIAYPDRFEIHDTKGHLRPQWWVKFKTLKERNPYLRFATVKKIKGLWEVKYL